MAVVISADDAAPLPSADAVAAATNLAASPPAPSVSTLTSAASTSAVAAATTTTRTVDDSDSDWIAVSDGYGEEEEASDAASFSDNDGGEKPAEEDEFDPDTDVVDLRESGVGGKRHRSSLVCEKVEGGTGDDEDVTFVTTYSGEGRSKRSKIRRPRYLPESVAEMRFRTWVRVAVMSYY